MNTKRTVDGSRRAAVVVALVLVFAATAVAAADWSRYTPQAIGDLLQGVPRASGLAIMPEVPIRSRVRYSGEVRPLADDSRRLILAWSKSMNVPAAADAFRQEIRIQEPSGDYWVPVQEALVPAMRTELKSGDQIEVFLIFVGHVDGRPMLLVNAFNH